MRHFKIIITPALTALLVVVLGCSNGDKAEVAKLDHSFTGCFGFEKNSIVLYEKAGSTFGKLEKNGRLVRKIKLSQEQISSFNSFVDQLRKLKEEDGCTSVEDYILYTKNETIKRTDGGCSWDGFNILQQAIFDISEE